MYSIFNVNLLIAVMIFSGCSMIEIEESDESVIENEANETAEFLPVEVESGLIEMERKDNGIYISPEMVLINGGNFIMNDKINNSSVQINIKYEYFFSKYEITFEEYDKFARNTKRTLPNDSGWGRGKQPVINISYEDAVAYAEWLSKKSGDYYRLPSEAEWEFAFRGGSDPAVFFNGGENGLSLYGWFSVNSVESTHQIGNKMPNGWNIYDTVGNVWEWCQDIYQADLVGIPNDGKPRQNKKSDERVVKGGSWNDSYQNLKQSNRLGFISSLKMNDTGFRLVMETRKKSKKK